MGEEWATLSTTVQYGRRRPGWPLDHLLLDRSGLRGVSRYAAAGTCRSQHSIHLSAHCSPLHHVHVLTAAACTFCTGTVMRRAATPSRACTIDILTGQSRCAVAALELGAQHIHPTHTRSPDLAPSALTHPCARAGVEARWRRDGRRRERRRDRWRRNGWRRDGRRHDGWRQAWRLYERRR